MRHFTRTWGFVVIPYKSNTYSMFVLQACLCATHVHVSPCALNQLNAKDTDMEKAGFK